MIVWCSNLTILLLGLAFHCFLLQKIENRYATALAGHRAAILFNYNLQDVVEQFRVGLHKAYEENYDLIVGIADR